MRKWHIASCSFGKDSLAMVLGLIEKGLPLDEVVFYDTGAEFNAIYKERDKLLPVLQANGIKYTELKPERAFFYDMLEKPVYSKKNGQHCGYGWCGGTTRWGTTEKTKALAKYSDGIVADGLEVTHYVGIAADEKKRIAGNIDRGKTLPLVDWGWTEARCLEYCYSKGAIWDENGVRLYDVLDRVSCWCCSNKNKKELQNLYEFLPEYWGRLKELQSKIQKPMKRWENKKYGNYGNVYDMERVFSEER